MWTVERERERYHKCSSHFFALKSISSQASSLTQQANHYNSDVSKDNLYICDLLALPMLTIADQHSVTLVTLPFEIDVEKKKSFIANLI